MKTVLFVLILLPFIGFAQYSIPMPKMVTFKSELKEEVICMCGHEAWYPGGPYALQSFVNQQLQSSTFLPNFPSGKFKVYVLFIVEEDGDVVLQEIEQIDFHPVVQLFIQEIFQTMPFWVPSEYGCSNVSTLARMAIQFEIHN